MCIEFLEIQKCTIRGESPYEIRHVFSLMKKGLPDTNNFDTKNIADDGALELALQYCSVGYHYFPLEIGNALR